LWQRAGTGTQLYVSGIIFKELVCHTVPLGVSSKPVFDFFVDFANVEVIWRELVYGIVAEVIVKQRFEPECHLESIVSHCPVMRVLQSSN
jgi:hypothetical protein